MNKTVFLKPLMALAVSLFLAGCSKTPEEQPAKRVADQKAPDVFRVNFDTSRGPFVVEVSRAWAPVGADRFYTLVQDKFFDNARFFRVVPNFMVQFGLAADPAVTKKWEHTDLPDEPVAMHNTRGTISFAKAGPNTRTTQVFINFGDNSSSLDRQGFSPFGHVVSGLDVVDHIFPGYGEQPDQNLLRVEGNGYAEKAFPNLDYIKTARIGG